VDLPLPELPDDPVPVPPVAGLPGDGPGEAGVTDGLGEADGTIPPDVPEPPPGAPPDVTAPLPAACDPSLVVRAAVLNGFGGPIAPETAQASTPNTDRPTSSAMNRRRQ
jgi:hypothetical protein